MLRLEDKYGIIIDNILNKYIKSTKFGWDGNDFCYEVDNIENYIYHKPAEAKVVGSMWVSTGATKMVIGSNELNCVLKIPFQGTWWDEEIDDEYTESHFDEFCHGDYCYSEVDIYQHAKAFGVAEVFAETSFVGDLKCGIPVYKQVKVLAINESGSSRTPSNAAIKKAKDRYYSSPFSTPWTALVIDIYGEEYFDKLMTFIDDICPEIGDDWHSGNYGYTYDGLPIILDYSGYFE